MSRNEGLDRRAFLRKTGMTAVLGAAGVGGAAGALGVERAGAAPPVDLEPHPVPPGGSPRDGLSRRARQARQSWDFDDILDRVGTDCTKWDGAIAEFGEDIEVGMGIADQDFRAAPCITRALSERCRHENWGYLRRPESFTRSIVDWNKRRYDLDIDPETIVLTTGVHAGLISALQTFAPPGSRVLMASPIYSGFYSDLRYTRTVAEESPMRLVDGRYVIDFDDFERRARRAHALILCNPQNPTGNCWSAEDLNRIGQICLEHRVVVLADEIHCDFVSEGETYTPFASLPDREIVDNSLTFKSATKSFSISAMKVAWYFSTNRDFLERVSANTRADLSTLGLVATEAALTEGDDWLDALIPYIDGNHAFAEAYVRENVPLVGYTKAQGTYLAWLDVADLVDAIGAKEAASEQSEAAGREVTPERVVQRWLAENAKVALGPGSSYGTGGAGRMRMNLATSRQLVERALENMAGAVARL